MLDEPRADAEIAILSEALGRSAKELGSLFGRGERGLGHTQTSVMFPETIITIAMSNTMQCDPPKVKMILAHIILMPHTSNMSEKKNPLGPSGQLVASNVKRLRTEQRITYAELSRKLSDMGRPIPTLGLSRIESEERRIDVDDLIAISIALDVSPITLLLSHGEDSEMIEVTGAGTTKARDFSNFVQGYQSLTTKGLDFALRSLPQGQRFSKSAGWTSGSDFELERTVRTDGETTLWRNEIGHLDPWDKEDD